MLENERRWAAAKERHEAEVLTVHKENDALMKRAREHFSQMCADLQVS